MRKSNIELTPYQQWYKSWKPKSGPKAKMYCWPPCRPVPNTGKPIQDMRLELPGYEVCSARRQAYAELSEQRRRYRRY